MHESLLIPDVTSVVSDGAMRPGVMQGHVLRFIAYTRVCEPEAHVTHSSPGALGGEKASVVSGCERPGTKPWNHLLKMVTGTNVTGIPEGMVEEKETGSTCTPLTSGPVSFWNALTFLFRVTYWGWW